MAKRLKRLSSKQEIPGSNPGIASFSNHTLVCNYDYQVDLSKLFSSIVHKHSWGCGLAVKAHAW